MKARRAARVAIVALAGLVSACSSGSKPLVTASTPLQSPPPSVATQDFVDTEVPQPPPDFGWKVKEQRSGVFSSELSPGFKMDADKLLSFYKDALQADGWTLRDEGGPKGYDLGSQKWSKATTDLSFFVMTFPGGTSLQFLLSICPPADPAGECGF